MANRATNIVSVLLVGAIVGIPLSTFARDASAGSDVGALDSSTPGAIMASECLTTRNREPPPGQRWIYRMEPGTNKRCWVLRDLADRASQTASRRANSPQTSNAGQSLPAPTFPTPKTFAKNPQASRSLSNARAELGARSNDVDSGPTVPKTPVFITSSTPKRGASIGADANQGTSTTLYPSESTAASLTGSSPDGTSADIQSGSSNLNTGLAPSSASEMPAMATMPQEKSSVSLQVLFVVILGALALAGILASVIHRMSRIRRRRYARSRRRSFWPGADGELRESRAAVASGHGRDRRPNEANPDGNAGQIKRFLTEIARQARGEGKSKKRLPAKPRAGSAARARTQSTRRGVRASAARP